MWSRLWWVWLLDEYNFILLFFLYQSIFKNKLVTCCNRNAWNSLLDLKKNYDRTTQICSLFNACANKGIGYQRHQFQWLLKVSKPIRAYTLSIMFDILQISLQREKFWKLVTYSYIFIFHANYQVSLMYKKSN